MRILILVALLLSSTSRLNVATPTDINTNPQRHSDGPMVTADDMARSGRVVVYYRFDLRDSTTNRFYAQLNELAKEFTRAKLLVIASARHRGHLNDVWSFSKDQTGSHARCKVTLFQNISINGLEVPNGHGVIWASDGRMVHHGELHGQLDLVRQAVEGGGGMLPPGQAIEHHQQAASALTALEQPVGNVLTNLRAASGGTDAAATEAAELVAHAEAWANRTWSQAEEQRAVDSTGYHASLQHAAALLAGDELAQRFDDQLRALSRDRDFRGVLRNEAKLDDLLQRADAGGLPRTNGDDQRANAARAQLGQALQRFIDRNPDTSIAAKATAALTAWNLTP